MQQISLLIIACTEKLLRHISSEMVASKESDRKEEQAKRECAKAQCDCALLVGITIIIAPTFQPGHLLRVDCMIERVNIFFQNLLLNS